MGISVPSAYRRRVSGFLQMTLILVWLSNLAATDSNLLIYVICAFAGVFACLDNLKNNRKAIGGRRVMISAAAALFSLAVILSNYELFTTIGDPAVISYSTCVAINLINSILNAAGGYVLFRNVFLFLTERLPIACKATGLRNRTLPVFVGVFGLLAVIYSVNLFLVEYPGNASRDTLYQIMQGYTGEYNTDHPFWHTYLLNVSMRIGYFLFSEVNAALAFTCFLQLLVMAACASYLTVTIYQAGFPGFCVLLTTALFAVVPYNIALSITLWKDVTFAAASLVVIVSQFRILRGLGRYSALNYGLFGLGSVVFCVMRSNGLMAYGVTIVLLLPFLWKRRKKLLAVMLAAVILGYLLTGPVLGLLGIGGSSITEALSIPLQQFARVICDGKSLTEEETYLLSQIFDLEEIPALYQCWLSDPIKIEARSNNIAFFEENLGQYGKLWISMAFKHPDSYIKAWIDQTKGYWNGGYDYHLYAQIIEDNAMGIAKADCGSILARLIDLYFGLSRHLILFQPLHAIGLHIWYIAVCWMVNLLKKREEWTLSILLLMVVCSLIVSTPVYAEFRYIYSVFLCCPLILCAACFEPGNE